MLAGRRRAAEAMMREYLAAQKRLAGTENLGYATGLGNLAEARRQQGDFAEARRMLEEALKIRRAKLPKLHPSLSLNLENLGQLSMSLADFEQAEIYLREANQINESLFGADSLSAARSRQRLAGIDQVVGRPLQARETLMQLVETYKRSQLTATQDYAFLLTDLGSVEYDLKLYADSEEHLRSLATR